MHWLGFLSRLRLLLSVELSSICHMSLKVKILVFLSQIMWRIKPGKHLIGGRWKKHNKQRLVEFPSKWFVAVTGGGCGVLARAIPGQASDGWNHEKNETTSESWPLNTNRDPRRNARIGKKTHEQIGKFVFFICINWDEDCLWVELPKNIKSNL